MNTVTPIADRLTKLPELTLRASNHDTFEEGHCALEVVAWLAGEKHSDHPACTCPAIAGFVRTWNDGLPDDETRTRVLGPLLPLLLNTRPSKTKLGDKLLVRRSYMAIDWSIRVRTPAFLRPIGLVKEAEAIEALPEITNARDLAAAAPIVSAARSAAYSAADSAADSAARSAAYSAADSAAHSAAYSAAYSAAHETIAKTFGEAIKALHVSGADLVRRMCALTEDDVKDWSWE